MTETTDFLSKYIKEYGKPKKQTSLFMKIFGILSGIPKCRIDLGEPDSDRHIN